MGNCNFNCQGSNEEDASRISLNNFKLLYPIGKGGFGRVWKVLCKKASEVSDKNNKKPINTRRNSNWGINNYKKQLPPSYQNKKRSSSTINRKPANDPSDIENIIQNNSSSRTPQISQWKNKPTTPHIYAMKEWSKSKIYMKKSVESIVNERKFLEKWRYPLLTNMHYAFQSANNLYIVMDFLLGGDWRYMICKRKKFTEEETKFVVCCLLLALEYMHSNHIIHRDVKPENLVFDSLGYLHLTDLGIAHEYHFGDQIMDSSGTPGYMAPEVWIKQPHDFAVDYFALGVITYELMMNKRPYKGKTRQEIREQVISKEVKLKHENLPTDWEDESVIDFINALLRRKAKDRLGARGIHEIKKHPWLGNVDWNGIENFEVESPFHFDTEDNFDEFYANKKDEEDYENKEYYIDMVNTSKIFKDFYYDKTLMESKEEEKINPLKAITIPDCKSTKSTKNTTWNEWSSAKSISKAQHKNILNWNKNSTAMKRNNNINSNKRLNFAHVGSSTVDPHSMKVSPQHTRNILNN